MKDEDILQDVLLRMVIKTLVLIFLVICKPLYCLKQPPTAQSEFVSDAQFLVHPKKGEIDKKAFEQIAKRFHTGLQRLCRLNCDFFLLSADPQMLESVEAR